MLTIRPAALKGHLIMHGIALGTVRIGARVLAAPLPRDL